MSKSPSGLNIIEAMVPKLSRFAFETKTDFFTELHAKDYLNSIVYQMIERRMEKSVIGHLKFEEL